MNEITIPINRNTIELIQQYAQTLESPEQETELANLKTEAQEFKKDKEK